MKNKIRNSSHECHLAFVWQRRNRREIERREKKHENQYMNLD
jgi:hypothetical protein